MLSDITSNYIFSDNHFSRNMISCHLIILSGIFLAKRTLIVLDCTYRIATNTDFPFLDESIISILYGNWLVFCHFFKILKEHSTCI